MIENQFICLAAADTIITTCQLNNHNNKFLIKSIEYLLFSAFIYAAVTVF